PRFDARGRFLGYEGTLRPVDPPAAPAAAPAAATSTSTSNCDDPERADQEAFAYAVSHDLRAPLRVVEGFTRIVKEDYGSLLDRIGNDHLDRVLGAAARMNGMIDALLEQARLSTQPMAREPVNLSQLAMLVMDDLRRTSPDRQAEVQIEDGLCAQGDPLLLRLVLENLLGNAWKYSSCRECASIALCCEQRAGEDGKVHRIYCVSDNGVGFDARYAQRLFGMFQRLHSATDYPGTGVGLASVRRIIHRHGGEIWAESQVDRGSRFYFTLEGGAPPRSEAG
ncbi:MAG: ATP-binding protein, partial [Aquabacterium sp.]|nr:ATP-binding protein [Aquabacterium sp.]